MIHPHQVLSLFREGLDTVSISVHFGITEAQACNLLDAARRAGFQINFEKQSAGRSRGQMRGALNASIVNRKVPVTLAAVSFLRDEP